MFFKTSTKTLWMLMQIAEKGVFIQTVFVAVLVQIRLIVRAQSSLYGASSLHEISL